MNKILRTIIGLPLVSFFWIFIGSINLFCFLIFAGYGWVVGESIDIHVEILEELSPISPYRFVKNIWGKK